MRRPYHIYNYPFRGDGRSLAGPIQSAINWGMNDVDDDDDDD